MRLFTSAVFVLGSIGEGPIIHELREIPQGTFIQLCTSQPGREMSSIQPVCLYDRERCSGRRVKSDAGRTCAPCPGSQTPVHARAEEKTCRVSTLTVSYGLQGDGVSKGLPLSNSIL